MIVSLAIRIYIMSKIETGAMKIFTELNYKIRAWKNFMICKNINQ